MIPYGQKLISDYLRGHAAIAALGSRVVSKVPESTGTAWIQVTQIAADDEAEPIDHLIGFHMQLDCYAGADGGLPEADLLARTVRAALHDMAGTHAEGVVSGVRILGHSRVPDTDFKPARERLVLDVQMFAHPVPA